VKRTGRVVSRGAEEATRFDDWLTTMAATLGEDVDAEWERIGDFSGVTDAFHVELRYLT
jgi:hypothetical protein